MTFLHSTHNKNNTFRGHFSKDRKCGIKFHRQMSSPIWKSLQIYRIICLSTYNEVMLVFNLEMILDFKINEARIIFSSFGDVFKLQRIFFIVILSHKIRQVHTRVYRSEKDLV